MNDSFRLTQIATVVYLITKVKQLSNYIHFFKQGINENLEIPMDFASYVNNYGEREAQKALDKAVARLLDSTDKKSQISVGDYLLNIPKVHTFLAEVTTLDDLVKSLDKYLQAYPRKQKKLVEYHEPKKIGVFCPFTELPLYEAEAFINKFHEVLNQPPELPFVVTPDNLNRELKILFNNKETAEEYARKLCPSELWQRLKDGSLEKIGSY
ncbi:MAG TPA: hypothetical protein GXX46_08830 [Peptococcaceae bacterium]|nr:hypothetical protein [Peptococcaceae bacterium]